MKKIFNHSVGIKKAVIIISLAGCMMIATTGAKAQTAGPDQTICQYGFITMAATGSGTWSELPTNPNPENTDSLGSPTAHMSDFGIAGIYGFLWSGAPGDTVYITVKPLPATALLDTFGGTCLGHDTLVATGASGVDSLIWLLGEVQVYESAAADSVYIPTAPGIYQIATVGFNGCRLLTGFDSILITNCGCSLTASGSIGAHDSNFETMVASPTGGTGPYSYLWSTGSTYAIDSISFSGIYYCTVTDHNGCSAVLADTTDGYFALICPLHDTITYLNLGANEYQFTSYVTGGTPAVHYQWIITGATYVSGTDSVVVYSLPPNGTYQIQCYVWDGVTTCDFMDSTLYITTSCNVHDSISYVNTGNNVYQFTAHPSGATRPSYYWYTSFGSATAYSITADFTLPSSSMVAVMVNVYDSATGCFNPDTLYIYTSCNNCSSTFDTITICLGSSYTMQAAVGVADSFVSYQWLPTTGLSNSTVLNPVATPAFTTIYTLVATDTAGMHYLDTVIIVVDPVCSGFIWPGDADENGVVNNIDLLTIGLTYGFTGPARAQQDISWYAHYGIGWPGTNSGGVNDVYADCDGNGTVNINDVLAIVQNYSLTHTRSVQDNGNRNGAPVLSITAKPDTVLNGDTLTCHIFLGDSSIPATSVYGLAFTFNFNAIVIDTASLQMTFPDSWLATHSQHITLAVNNYASGAIYAGLSRIDQTSRSGAGEIATVSMVITTDNIDGKNLSYYTTQFSITGIKVINQSGDSIPVNASGDSAIIGFIPTGLTDEGPGAVKIKLFPDPANNSTQIISTGGKMSGLTVSDILGRQMVTYNEMNASNFNLPTANLLPGMYLAEIQVGNNHVVKKFLVQH